MAAPSITAASMDDPEQSEIAITTSVSVVEKGNAVPRFSVEVNAAAAAVTSVTQQAIPSAAFVVEIASTVYVDDTLTITYTKEGGGAVNRIHAFGNEGNELGAATDFPVTNNITTEEPEPEPDPDPWLDMPLLHRINMKIWIEDPDVRDYRSFVLAKNLYENPYNLNFWRSDAAWAAMGYPIAEPNWSEWLD